VYQRERIGVRQIGAVPIATLLPPGLLTLNTIYNVFIVSPAVYDLRFVLGVVCSRPLAWYWRQRFWDEKQTFPKVKKAALLGVPIPVIGTDSPARLRLHDDVVSAVRQLLSLNGAQQAARTPQNRTSILRQIDALERQIDVILAELYGLTDTDLALMA
jgi:hypothetical protein